MEFVTTEDRNMADVIVKEVVARYGSFPLKPSLPLSRYESYVAGKGKERTVYTNKTISELTRDVKNVLGQLQNDMELEKTELKSDMVFLASVVSRLAKKGPEPRQDFAYGSYTALSNFILNKRVELLMSIENSTPGYFGGVFGNSLLSVTPGQASCILGTAPEKKMAKSVTKTSDLKYQAGKTALDIRFMEPKGDVGTFAMLPRLKNTDNKMSAFNSLIQCLVGTPKVCLVLETGYAPGKIPEIPSFVDYIGEFAMWYHDHTNRILDLYPAFNTLGKLPERYKEVSDEFAVINRMVFEIIEKSSIGKAFWELMRTRVTCIEFTSEEEYKKEVVETDLVVIDLGKYKRVYRGNKMFLSDIWKLTKEKEKIPLEKLLNKKTTLSNIAPKERVVKKVKYADVIAIYLKPATVISVRDVMEIEPISVPTINLNKTVIGGKQYRVAAVANYDYREGSYSAVISNKNKYTMIRDDVDQFDERDDKVVNEKTCFLLLESV